MNPVMPDGRPAPYLLTQEELCEFMRLDVKDVHHAVLRLRKGGLQSLQSGRRIVFPLPEVCKFCEKQMQLNPK